MAFPPHVAAGTWPSEPKPTAQSQNPAKRRGRGPGLEPIANVTVMPLRGYMSWTTTELALAIDLATTGRPGQSGTSVRPLRVFRTPCHRCTTIVA
jgi:hypothetical protein